MKKLIYGTLIVISFLIVFTILLLYYTQDFSEDFFLKDAISLSEVTSNSNGNYIDFISVNLGSVSLENKGYFSQVYIFPKIIGCIISKENGPIKFNPDNFNVYLTSGNTKELNYLENLEIDVGEKKTFEITARYYPNHNPSVSLQQMQDSLDKVVLYKLNQKEQNPFGNSYYSYEYQDCSKVSLTEKPMKTISFLS